MNDFDAIKQLVLKELTVPHYDGYLVRDYNALLLAQAIKELADAFKKRGLNNE